MPVVSARKDEELLRAVRSGDASALRDLLARHAPSVFRFAMAMCRDRADAEDIAQETLLAAVRGTTNVRGTSSFTTWLYAVARNACLRSQRRRRRHTDALTTLDGALSGPTHHPSMPDDEASAKQLVRTLEAGLNELDDKYREAVILRDVEGLSAPEVAEVLGVSVEAVKSRLHRGRSELRARLEEFSPAPRAAVVRSERPCAEIDTTFSKYLEGEIGPIQCAEMKRHVDGCNSCSAACEGIRRTVGMCQQAKTLGLPEELQRRLRRALESALAAAAPAPRNDGPRAKV